jgi:hypothetical protein
LNQLSRYGAYWLTCNMLISGFGIGRRSCGGTAQGDPVAAAYTLPASQVMTFVGFEGTFTPAKTTEILSRFGTDSQAYPAGPNGGILTCANTATTPSGAICVWATGTTLGVTEFYSATGPEVLTTGLSQSTGAADTLASMSQAS